MKYLKIEDNKGFYYKKPDSWVEVNKMIKEDLYNLVNSAIDDDDFEIDEFEEDKLLNPAHKTIYNHVSRQLTDIHDRRQEYRDEISSLYKEPYDKYCSL